VIYVNAGIAAPDPAWLTGLRPDGRLIFPWQPFGREGGVALLVTREAGGFRARATMQVGFVACEGSVPDRGARGRIGLDQVERTRSVWLTRERAPDETATAVYDTVWFSTREVGPQAGT
jgi:protein-L-isoaspartate(D-aspartate) O-methyltransferase